MTLEVVPTAIEEEPIVPMGRKLILTYSRTVQVRSYEPAHVAATMEVELPPGTTVDQARSVFNAEYAVLKGEVLKQLDIGFEWDDENQMVRETPTQRVLSTFEDSAVVGNQIPAPTFAPAPNPFVPPPSTQPQGFTGDNAMGSGDPDWDSIYSEYHSAALDGRDATTHLRSWYNNRINKKNPKGPDFAHKTLKNDKGFPRGVWLSQCPDAYKDFFFSGQG